MRPRSLVVLLALVVVLGTFIWFVERDLPGSDERAERAKLVLDLEPDQVTALAWGEGDERVELVRDGEAESAGWRLTAPMAARADDGAVDSLVAALTALEKERTIEDGEAAQMGLSPPRAELAVGVGERRERLLVGGEVPASSSMIVAPSAEGPYYVVDGGLWGELDRAPGDWRSRDVLPADRDSIRRLELTRGGETVTLARRGEQFWIEQPLVDRADGGQVGRLLDSLTALEVDEFVDDPATAESELGLEPPAATLAATLDDGESWLLELGAAVTDPGGRDDAAAEGEGEDVVRRYARAEGQLFIVEDDLVPALERPAQEWRSLEWATLQVYEIDRLEISEGGETTTLERDAGQWRRDGALIDFDTAADLLYAITGTKAVALDAGDRASGEPILSIRLNPGGEAQRLEVYAAVGDRHPASAGDREVAVWLGGDRVRAIVDRLSAVRAAEAEAEEEPAPVEDAAD